jgi:predicted nicotinamide N-methyase
MGDEVADEGDWYAALVAGEHVGDWLDTIRNAKIPPGRRTRAASQLAEKVAADPTYADEARESDAADVCDAAARDVPKGDTHDERFVNMREAFEACAAACRGARERSFSFEGGHDVVVREIALGAGVGAKVWRAAIMLSEELAANPGWCEGKRCLEIGAGVGLCGLLASRLGASSVALTDFEHPLLDSLVVAVDRNRELLESVNNATLTSTTTTVRRLDWIEDSERRSKTDADAENVKKPNGNEERLGPTSRGWIEMDDEATFDFIFGSDLLYEDVHARTLPGVVKRRMSAPDGRCRVVGAVRNRSMLDALVLNMRKEGLVVVETHLRDNDTNAADWYEDGYCALEVTHGVE